MPIRDLFLQFGPYDISGESNMAEATNSVALSRYLCAPPAGTVGQLPVPTRDAVGEDMTISAAGYTKLAGATAALMTGTVHREAALVAVADTRGVGEPVVFTLAHRAEYSRTATVGDSLQWTFTAMTSAGPIWWGLQGAYVDVSADGPGDGFEFGVVASDQTLTVALGIERLSGTGSIVVTWETAADDTFAGATTVLTFASVTAVGEEILTAAGPDTNAWGRPVFNVTGTGVFRVRAFVNIQ